MAEPIDLLPPPPDGARITTTRGRTRPRAIAWFGFSSFWGHLRHLVAAAIATENVDSRKWMVPDEPIELTERILELLEAQGTARDASTLLQALGRDLWLDFVADTGDDVSVSERVAQLVTGTYRKDKDLILPRGDVLMFGGDTAYPVATVREITRRVLDPWNRVFEAADDQKRRVLLAIPGNHDWYDGLDGFARLFQAPCAFEGERSADEALHPRTSEFPLLDWAEAFTRGEARHKPGALAFFGYIAVQSASYFRIPLGPGLELFAVDRQLRQIDERQKAYFDFPRTRARILFLPDPARAWGETRPTGAQVLKELAIDASQSPTLLVSGDVHHYERSEEGPSVHVVAGGGGAFLHGARVAKNGLYKMLAEFPGPKASARYLAELPLFVATGRAGLVLTSVLAFANFLALRATFRWERETMLAVATSIVVAFAVGAALLVGWRRHRMGRVVPFAILTGAIIGLLPLGLGVVADRVAVSALGESLGGRLGSFTLAWALATFVSGLAFGTMLALIARLGLNHAQPFAALGIPTYKHFVRFRFRAENDETKVDGYVIGLVDPLSDAARPVLVDEFHFSSRRGATTEPRPS